MPSRRGSDDSSSDGSVEVVELGFLEALPPGERPAVESSSAALWDGGKAGGVPAWLQRRGAAASSALPSPSALLCRRCGSPLTLLLQL